MVIFFTFIFFTFHIPRRRASIINDVETKKRMKWKTVKVAVNDCLLGARVHEHHRGFPDQLRDEPRGVQILLAFEDDSL